MSDVQHLRDQLCPNFITIAFSSWAQLRNYTIVEGVSDCLKVIRHDSEDLRETIAYEPNTTHFHRLVTLLAEPTLRMLTIITAGTSEYKAIAKDSGVEFIGDGGKIMTIDLKNEFYAENSKEQPINVTLKEQGCHCSAEVLVNRRVVASGKAAVDGTIATFDGLFTEIEFQRRGLATAIMRRLSEWSYANGATTGLLCASPFGQKLYASLGWTEIYDVLSLGGSPILGFHERMRKKYAS